MRSVEEAIPLLNTDGSVTYTTYDALPTDIYVWDYWAKDPERSHFRFQLVPVGNVFRIYILSQPDYRGRDTGSHSTHRHRDGDGRYYICINADLEPRTVAECMTWYSFWSECTVKYIQNGGSFA
ncbi:MAG: hypothetical protein KGZ73_09260 [Rhizobiales bacterium]|nr:hypothetical protein [Hyphomicrobiales bacterium]